MNIDALNEQPSLEHRRSNGMRVASLFSGIGGFEVGLARAGHSVSLFCEKDRAAQAVLREHFPSVLLATDISELDELSQSVGLIAAGFPCQNLSRASDKSGISGSKSRLGDEVFPLTIRHPVRWGVFENVFFMFHLDKG